MTIPDSDSERILQHILKATRCVRFQESGYKLLTRWYRTPGTLHKMYPDCPDQCWRCGERGENLLNVFWSCPRIRSYWERIASQLNRFTDHQIPGGPSFLLHHNPFPKHSYKSSVLPHLLNAARSCVAEYWKRPDPPTLSTWLEKVNDIMRMETMISADVGEHEQCALRWHY